MTQVVGERNSTVSLAPKWLKVGSFRENVVAVFISRDGLNYFSKLQEPKDSVILFLLLLFALLNLSIPPPGPVAKPIPRDKPAVRTLASKHKP